MTTARSRSCSFMAICLFMVIPAAASAAPITLYKPSQIANARENVKRYPWAREIVEEWKRGVSFSMTCDERFFTDMLSPVTPWPEYGQNCPSCVGRLSTMGETGIYEWTVKAPDKLTCRYCGAVYPNPKYPETGSISARRMGQTFTFYLTGEERAHTDDTSGKYAFRWASWPVHTSFSGILRYRRAAWCIGQVLPLAKLYAVTGEARYAERAALIMDLVAKVYPNWIYHSYNGTYADCPGGEAAAEMGKNPPAGRFPVETIITAFPGLHTKDGYAVLNNGFWGAGRFGCSGTDAGMILNMAVAYDLIRGAKRPDGGPVIVPEADRQIVNDLILAGCADSENYDEINNKCGPNRSLSAAAGILFGRPESVRRALAGFEALMEKSFHFDGFCEESPSYSDMHLSLMRNIPEILIGYSDPSGYTPRDGRILKNFDPFREVGRYRLALESMVRMLDCNRKYPVIGDTHYGEGISPIYAEILSDRYDPRYAGLLEEAQGAPLREKGSEYALWNRHPGLTAASRTSLPLRSEWFPGWHVGVLRGGAAASTTALYFNGYAHGGHRHRDTLGIAYSAFGKELASDRGYIWDDPRNAWTASTPAHNLVTVDGGNQNGEGCRSTLDFFAASPGIEVVQASANAYRQCDRYLRTTVLVKIDTSRTYAVDFFRVDGGTSHRYTLNCNGSLSGIDGADLKPVSGEIKWLANFRAVEPAGPFTVTWEHDGIRFDMTMLNPVNRLLVADAPGWRNNRGSDLNAPPIQEIIAERTDASRASSRFAAVLAPYTGAKSPVKAARLIADDPATGALAIAVELDGRTDYIISSLDSERRTYGPVSMTGRFGFVSVDAKGAVRASFLLDGTELRCSGYAHTMSDARIPLRIASAKDRTFTLAEALPSGLKLKGACLLAGDTGYEIESASGRTITVRDYPTIPCDMVTVINASWKTRSSKEK